MIACLRRIDVTTLILKAFQDIKSGCLHSRSLRRTVIASRLVLCDMFNDLVESSVRNYFLVVAVASSLGYAKTRLKIVVSLHGA